ncbi:hypothetical protein [Pseudomonas cremoricolorata]|uniref:hypothetical protein n=1 Tax=Pseudomonas cremoricolorata TaxID=157783 RepID=UPI00042051E1|nr:hypothetical protein [Pseudomonas cremoricolorata]
MSKRLHHLLANHWRIQPLSLHPSSAQVMQLLALALIVPGALLVVSGLAALDIAQLAVGVIAIAAGWQMRPRPAHSSH